jgi:DNA-binding NtrC family response regulator
MRILFIEDEWELNEVASEQLRSMGHQVSSVLGIEEARRFMDDHPDTTDLIIADHRLPDGQGVKFVIEARKVSPRLKVAIVSGCLNDDDIALLQQERIHYFHKPLIYSTVLRALTRPPKGPIEIEISGLVDLEQSGPEPMPKARWMCWPFRKQLVESTRK